MRPSLTFHAAAALALLARRLRRARRRPSPAAALADLPRSLPARRESATSRSRQLFVVQATYADGITRDVTAEAKATLANPALAKLDKNLLTPLADGATELKVEFGGKTVSVPVKVKDAAKDRPISFKLDVMPVFMRTGCNQGSCHGAARGKDGFRLSLFGFDPDGDHYRLTREMNGRRINLALPDESLLLEKAAGQGAAHRRPAHQGRRRVPPDAHPLARGRRPARPADDAHAGRRRSLSRRTRFSTARARRSRWSSAPSYSDGSDRDVTSLALFLSNNDTSAKISPDGLVTAGDRGEAFVMARFATFTVGAPGHRAAQGAAVHLPAGPRKQLHRHAG